ncbi:MAG: T9SS type A sorting domain-containing protein [Winogradskyella arenosi]
MVLLNVIVTEVSSVRGYELYALDGRLIIEAQPKTNNSIFQIDVSKLERGTYVLKLNSAAGQTLSKKIIVSD